MTLENTDIQVVSAPAARRTGLSRRQIALLMQAPSVALICVFFVLPILSIIVLAFWRTESYQIIPDFTLSNFHAVLFEGAYLTFFLRSFITAVAVSTVSVILAWPIAYFIVRVSGRWALLLGMLFALPFFTGEVIRLIALQGLLGPVGLINSMMMWMGLQPIRALIFTPIASAIGIFYLYLPTAVTALCLSLVNFDFRLADAARTFGAGPVRTFLEVTWPLNLVGTLVGFILCFVPALSSALAPRFLGGPNGTLFGMSLAQQFGDTGTWSLGAAMGVFLFAATLLMVFMLSRAVNPQRSGFSGGTAEREGR
ncbi:ABC transporter permease [Paenirhodobacter populi]|nr:ABC transporter permease [Sinirhodobacter populi]